MAYLNENYSKLKAGYLFPEIARRVKAFTEAHPDAAGRVIRCGIGDVTEPLPAACREALHKAVDELGQRETFRGKRIVIAGGGDTAVDWALSLAEIAGRVSVIHRRDRFRAAPDSEARLKALAKEGRIDLVVPYQLHGLEGDNGQLTSVTVATLDGQTIVAEVLARRLESPLDSFLKLTDAEGKVLAVNDDPALVRALMSRCHEYGFAYGRALAAAGADVLTGGDSPAGLIGPQRYREFALPFE